MTRFGAFGVGCALLMGGAGCAHEAAPSREARSSKPAGPVELEIIGLNDFHGHLEPPDGGQRVGEERVPAGGIAHLAARVRALRDRAEHAIVVSAGDLVGASPLTSALFHDEPTIDGMDLLGLDINGVGNHELDEGLDELLRMKRGGCHPKDGCTLDDFDGSDAVFLAANVRHRETGETIFPEYEIREFGGIQVGFIGLTLEDTPAMLPPIVPELSFEDETRTINHVTAELREQGVRAIVVLLHEGGFTESKDPNACPGLSGPIVEIVKGLDAEVDLVLSGHTHQAYVCEGMGPLLTSGGSFGRVLTEIRATLDPTTNDFARIEAHNRVVDHAAPPAKDVEQMVARVREKAAPLANRVVAQIEAPITRTRTDGGVSALGRVIADAQLAATGAQGAELAFMNDGGIRASLEPGDARLTYGMLFAAQPFSNLLVTLSLPGRRILEALNGQLAAERRRWMDASSNVSYRWTEHEDGTGKVLAESVEISGEPLDPDRIYRVTVNAYMASRGVFADGTHRDTSGVDLDALVEYFEARSPFTPPSLDGVRRDG